MNLQLSYYDPSKLSVPIYESKAFNFHYYISNQTDFDKMVNRWKIERNRINNIETNIVNSNSLWDIFLKGTSQFKPIDNIVSQHGGEQCQNKLTPYQRDLRGLYITISNCHKISYELHYTNFDYCYFFECNYNIPFQNIKWPEFIFFENSIQHVKFEKCHFENLTFYHCNINNVLFDRCTFINVAFHPKIDNKYSSILFNHCKFSRCNFERINIDDLYLTDDCEINRCNFKFYNFSFYSPGKNTLFKLFMSWDLENYKIRRKIKNITRVNNSPPIINYYTWKEKKHHISKFQSAGIISLGLFKLYNYIMNNHGSTLTQEDYINLHYKLNWVLDFSSNKNKYRKYLSRFVFGYGHKPFRILFTLIALNFILSFVYIFSGLKIINMNRIIIIKRNFDFNFYEFTPTISDIFYSLYFSFLTSITISFGDILPGTFITRIIVPIHGILGIICTASFTVLIARRYFR